MIDILKWCTRVATGALAFVIANIAVGALASPTWPNAYGPVPSWVYGIVIVLTVGVLVGAALRPAWRAETAGFVLGYLVLMIATQGELTRTWSDGLSTLDFTRPLRGRMRMAVGRDKARVAPASAPSRQSELAAWTMSDAGRGELALHALAAGACALDARRGAAPGVSAATLVPVAGARSCASYRADADPRFTVSFAARPAQAGSPAFVMTLRPRDQAIGYPEFLVDESGLATVQLNARDAAHVVASPMDAAMLIRHCLRQRAEEVGGSAATRRARVPRISLGEARLVPLCGRLDLYIDSLARTPADSDALRLCVDVYGRQDCRARAPLVTYRVRLAEEPGALRIDPVRGSPGLRHYYVAASDSVFATGEPRDATPSDPPAARCEVNSRERCRPN